MNAITQTLSVQDFLDRPHRLVDVGEARIAYRRIGSGPDVLFLHGWPLNSSTFRGVANRLASRFTCHLIDLPGAGQTTGTAPIGMAEHARTVAGLLDVLELQDVALIGQDSGGTVARLVAIAHPDRIRALVLGNTEIPHDRSALIRLLVAIGRLPFTASVLRLLMGTGWLRRHRHIGFGSSFANPALVDQDFYTLALQPLLDSPSAMDDAAAFLAAFDMTLVDRLDHAHIHCPTRLIWGARDATFPLPAARQMMAQFGGPVDLVELPTGRLFAHEEFPDRFAALAAQWLSP